MTSSNLKQWWALTGVSIAICAVAMDFAIINTALPMIQKDLSATTLELQWMMNVITLAMCVFIPTMGRLGDIFGRRLIFYLGVIIYGTGSLLAGFSTNAVELITMRAIQGFGITMAFPCSLAIVTHTFDENTRSKAISIWSGVLGIGMAIGPAAGGFIVSIANWHWVFFFLVPFTLLSLLISFFSVQESRTTEKNVRIDWPGLLLLTVSMAMLIVGIIQGPSWGWATPEVILLITLGTSGLIIFYFVENRVSSPIINFQIIQHHLYLGGAIAGFTVGFFAWPVYFLLPLFFYDVQHYQPYQIGLILLIVTLIVAILSPLTGLSLKKIGFKIPIISGLLIYILTSVLLIFFSPHSTLWYVTITMVVFGIAWGLIYSAGPSASMSVIHKNHSGMASAAMITIRNFGSALGLAITIALFRYHDKLSLHKNLNTFNVHLSERDHHLIRSLLSDPRQALETLNQLGVSTAHKIFPLFINAFMHGFRIGMIVLLIASIIITIIVAILLHNKKSV